MADGVLNGRRTRVAVLAAETIMPAAVPPAPTLVHERAKGEHRQTHAGRIIDGIAGAPRVAWMSARVARFAVMCCLSFGQIAGSAVAAERPDAQLPEPEHRQMALVIGNSAYRGTFYLRNPKNDATDIAEKLKALGFSVVLGSDLSTTELSKTTSDFAARLTQQAAVGLFYYAGHAVQIGGANYLVGVDIPTAEVSKEAFKNFVAPFDLVISGMESSGTKVNIAILDACRDNPFAGFGDESSSKAGGRSLRNLQVSAAELGGAVRQPDVGTFIAFATSPNKAASDGAERNGTYTKYLLKYMSEEGLLLDELFRRVRKDVITETKGDQVPWDSSGLVAEFFFIPPKIETDLWQRTRAADQEQGYVEYMTRYPAGRFATLAGERLKLLRDKKTWEKDNQKSKRFLMGTF